MRYHKQSSAVDLGACLEKALQESISVDDISALSLSSRCALIRKILDANKNPRYSFKKSVTRTSLIRLSEAFEISDRFKDWQNQKRRILINKLKERKNKYILTGFKNWQTIPDSRKQFVLRQSVLLHRNTYVDGIVEALPFTHDFKHGAFRQCGTKISIIFGSFSGDLKTGHGRLTQYTLFGQIENEPLEAFDTAHHEATHLIQHHLSYAFQKNRITASHPLLSAAQYFNSVDRHKAYIPSSENKAYHAQPLEIFAHSEGTKISNAIETLAL